MAERKSPAWHEAGVDPDYRFSLANERTFLAWIRTALGILAGAVLLHQTPLQGTPAWATAGLSAALSLMAGALGGWAYYRWRANESAMRCSQPLHMSGMPAVLAAAVLLLGFSIFLGFLVRI